MTRKEIALREEVLSLFKRRVLVTKSAVRTASRVLKASAEANPTRRKHEYWCSNCGGKFATPLDEPHVCPHRLPVQRQPAGKFQAAELSAGQAHFLQRHGFHRAPRFPLRDGVPNRGHAPFPLSCG